MATKRISRRTEDNAEHQALLATAYHEAGHAVVGIVQGNYVESVTIVPNADDDSLGVCLSPSVFNYHYQNARKRRTIARSCIVSCYAGMAAQRFVDPQPKEFHGMRPGPLPGDLGACIGTGYCPPSLAIRRPCGVVANPA